MQNELTNSVDEAPPCYFPVSRQRQIYIVLMLNTSVNLNEFFIPYFPLYKIPFKFFNSDYSEVQTVQTDFCLLKLYFMLLIQTQIEQIQCIKNYWLSGLIRGHTKITSPQKCKMLDPSPLYVTISHFSHYTHSSSLCHQAKSDIFFLN